MRTLRDESKKWRIFGIFPRHAFRIFCRRRSVVGRGRFNSQRSARIQPTPPSVVLLPEPAADHAERESGNPAQHAGDRDERKEVPQPANEFAARELGTQKLPGERRRPDEADEKRTVRRNVLDGGASQLIELGLNDSSRADATSKTPGALPSSEVLLLFWRKRNLSVPTRLNSGRVALRQRRPPYVYSVVNIMRRAFLDLRVMSVAPVSRANERSQMIRRRETPMPAASPVSHRAPYQTAQPARSRADDSLPATRATSGVPPGTRS